VAFIPATVDTFVVCGGQKGNGLHVLHNQTGQLLWMKPIGGLYGRHPVIDDHFIYIVGDSLYCLDIRDGETLWSYPAANQTTPVLDDTMLYITQTTKLTCLNKRSGQQQWQVQNKGKYLLIVDENHLYSENYSSIVARDKHDGNIRWSFPISYKQLAATGGNMGAANDQYLFFSIYLNADSLSTLYALDKQTGQEKWHYTFPKYGANAPIIANDIVYIYSGSKEYRIYAFDIHNGNILWKSAVIADGLPIIADHRLYIPSYSGIIIYQHQSTGLDEDHRRLSLPDFKLSAFPNPFNRQAMITYQLLQATQVSLSVYNLSGQIVSQLVNQTQGPGQYRIPWSTAEHSSGTYFFRLITPEGSQTGSLTKLK